MTAVWFVTAAAAGALVRHAVNLRGHGWRGTLAVNLAGSFLAGYLLAGASDTVVLVVGAGGCGSLTTFGMFALETVEARGSLRLTIVATTLVGTLGAVWLGHQLG